MVKLDKTSKNNILSDQTLRTSLYPPITLPSTHNPQLVNLDRSQCIEFDKTDNRNYVINITNITRLFTKRKDKQLIKLLEKYIKRNNITYLPIAYYYLGRIYCDFKSNYYNITKGVEYITIASNTYDHNGATIICAMWAEKMSERLKLFEKAAANNSKYAITWLGRYYYKKGYKKTGINLLLNAANQNYIDAINELGYIYYKQKDYPKSFNYYLTSHNLGNIIGTKHVGLMIKEGKGHPKDKTLAREYLTTYWMATKDHSVLD